MHRHLPGLIEAAVHTHADRPALRVERDGQWHVTTYAEMGHAVDRAAAALVAHGIGLGDRVAIYAGNRPEWTIADLAIMRAGAVTVTVYPTSTRDQVEFLLRPAGLP